MTIFDSSRYWPPSLGNSGPKSNQTETKNKFEEEPLTKKLKIDNDNFSKDPKNSNNSVSENKQKMDDQFYREMCSKFNQGSNLPANQYQFLSNNPVFSFCQRNLAQFSKSSPQKPNGKLLSS